MSVSGFAGAAVTRPPGLATSLPSLRVMLRSGPRSGRGSGTGLAIGAVTGLVRPAQARPADRTTARTRLALSDPDERGYRTVVRVRGEPHRVRSGLGVRAHSGRARRRRTLASFVQLTDVHLQDTQSPMRIEYLDRFSDTDPARGFATSAYRPQEMLTAQVAESMIRAVNRVAAGPVTGTPFAFAIQTGDNTDNCQYNEVRWSIDLLDGQRIRPDSGDPDRFEGVADRSRTSWDRRYWHPGGTPRGRRKDRPRDRHGFPVVPGLLTAARRPFTAHGLAIPWYSVIGNHEAHVQGGLNPDNLGLHPVAVGDLKLVSPPGNLGKRGLVKALGTDFLGFLKEHADTSAVRRVTPDPDRRLLSRGELIAEHFDTTGLPVGHGFTDRNRRDGTGYYSFTHDRVRFVVLDTVNPNGGSGGSLDQVQFAWLERKLAASQDYAVVVVSHHNVATMRHDRVGPADPHPRVLGPEVVKLLLRHSHVIAWINGHSHQNKVRPFRRRGATGGFWEINTASHIDWPQQSRLLEVVDNGDGTTSIFTTMLDHAAQPSYDHRTDGVLELAGLSRELAGNDWQEANDLRAGRRGDRNVELLVRTPRALR